MAQPIVVVGAGTAGLATAIAPQRRNHDASVLVPEGVLNRHLASVAARAAFVLPAGNGHA